MVTGYDTSESDKTARLSCAFQSESTSILALYGSQYEAAQLHGIRIDNADDLSDFTCSQVEEGLIFH